MITLILIGEHFCKCIAQFVNTDAFSVIKTDYDLKFKLSENNYIKNIIINFDRIIISNINYINKLRE